MELKRKFYDLMNARKTLLDEAKSILLKEGKTDAYTEKMTKIDEMNGQIETLSALIAENEKSFPGTGGSDLHDLPGTDGKHGTYEAAVKAFADAARHGFLVKAAGDMMSEGVPADGGYAVPSDISTKIIELRDSKESLLTEVTVIPVNTKSGSRTMKKRRQHTGFLTVEEAAKYGKAATPQFGVLNYNIKKRGGYLPVTDELLADSDNNIANVVIEWLEAEARATANNAILSTIKTKASTNLTDLDGILKAWVKLGSSFRSTSKLYTNDDGLAWLATLKDNNGRSLLSPNPADPKQLQVAAGPFVLPIKTYDNATMPTTGTKIPMILGDLKEGIAYWDRQTFSVSVSNTAVVGTLNAFEQDLTVWKGSLRDDCTKWDEDAFINGYVDTAASGNA